MKIRAIAALLFILISVSAFGEGRIKITGYVRDADGNPLELVNVRVKNTLIGSMTNERDIIPFPYRRGILSPLFTLVWDIIRLNVHSLGTSRYAPELQMNYTSFDLGEVSVTAIRKQTTPWSP